MRRFQTCEHDEIKEPKTITDVFPGRRLKTSTVSEREVQQLIKHIERLQAENKELAERTAEVEINRNKAVLDRIKLEEERDKLRQEKELLIEQQTAIRKSNLTSYNELKLEHDEITGAAISQVAALERQIQEKNRHIEELEKEIMPKLEEHRIRLDEALKKKTTPQESVYDRLYNQKKGQPGNGKKQ